MRATRPHTARLAAALLLCTAATATGWRQDPLGTATVIAVERWVRGVTSHVPGTPDAAYELAAALSMDERRELNGGFELFLTALLSDGVVTKTPNEERIVDIARGAKQAFGANRFLERAAVLHGDAVLLSPIPTPPLAPPGTPNLPLMPPHGLSTPLLFEGSLILELDGGAVGRIAASWQWVFARRLLGWIEPRHGDDAFVSAWFHATTAFMMGHRQFGEAVTHLAAAAQLLPDDALTLFDRACYAEMQGLPRTQRLREEQRSRGTLAVSRGRLTPGRGTSTLPSEEDANAQAERLFRQALAIDPSLAEARVRLARLLDLRGRHAEALAEISRAREGPDRTGAEVAFFASLFAGRAERALGHLNAADTDFRRARELFPRAQSALLASSQLGLLRASVPDVLQPLDALLRLPPDASLARDPWWSYDIGPGRDATPLQNQLWELARTR